MWAVLRQKYDLALSLWESSQQRLFLAAFAACVLGRLAKMLRHHQNEQQSMLQKQADLFEAKAIQFVEKCVQITPVR